ncbi:MAG: hypothetical protein ABEH83_02455 [Halobacterium sp.]
MPSSKPLAVALVAVVVLAGCSALPGGGGGDQTTAPEPPAHAELVFASHTAGDAFQADITVERGGETVFETTVDASGNGTYRDLTTIDGNGSYTVTVNTTIPGASGNRTEQFTVDDPGGKAVAVRAGPLGIYHEAFALPRRSVDHSLAAYHNAFPDDYAAGSNVTVRLWYRGERVGTATQSIPGSELVDLVELDETGVYRVTARGTGNKWHTELVVVPDADSRIKVTLHADGSVKRIEVVPTSWEGGADE